MDKLWPYTNQASPKLCLLSGIPHDYSLASREDHVSWLCCGCIPACRQAPTPLPTSAPSESPTEAPSESPSEVRQSSYIRNPLMRTGPGGLAAHTHI